MSYIVYNKTSIFHGLHKFSTGKNLRTTFGNAAQETKKKVLNRKQTFSIC